MIVERINKLEWFFRCDNVRYSVEIEDRLEHWLNKTKYNPKLNETRIISLDGIKIELILQEIIKQNNDECRDYIFKEDDLSLFNLAIKKISGEE